MASLHRHLPSRSISDLFLESGVIVIKHDGISTLPFAASFSKSSNSNLLAVSDEDGYVSIYDTRRTLPSFSSCQEKAAEARSCDWIAHNNAVFDVCWIKDDTQILTASGDQTIKIWSAERRKCVGILAGHTGSVKSICSHSSNPDLLASGSRDGSFAFWDLRCKSNSTNTLGEPRILSTAAVKDAHSSIRGKRGRSGLYFPTASTMYLQFYINENGDKVYTTKKESPLGLITQSAHPARFSPDDKYSRQRVLLKKRFGLLPTQKPPQKY